jgi:S-adenosylmethionine:tRNA ribosyltransferase-isomerase
MHVADFDYELPPDLIAQEPPPERGTSRLMVLDRATGAIAKATVQDLPDFLRPGDLLVLNDTRVFPARLLGRRVPSGGAVECLLLGHLAPGIWDALVHPGQKLEPGARFRVEGAAGALEGEILSRHTYGRRRVRLSPLSPLPAGPPTEPGGLDHPPAGREDAGPLSATTPGPCDAEPGSTRTGRGPHEGKPERHFIAQPSAGPPAAAAAENADAGVMRLIEALGHVPLPPYIRRPDTAVDRERYQTVYARATGSVAAPTAGLHFTAAILDALDRRGVERATLTLHVGYGTFKPVRVETVELHTVDPEVFEIPPDTARRLEAARREGRRIVAVGTTTTRALETAAREGRGAIEPGRRETSLFIYPGFEFRVVSALFTNFHLPRSSLLMLACAFGGRERVLAAYREAVADRFRFYSYGDAMLIV